jgi:hypothetical protein
MNFSTDRLDDYAKSMFAREALNPRWISQCAAYLRAVFGDKLRNAVFLDYAFGRGNWSVAALEAGARSVISVDASLHNVRKLHAYCTDHGLSAITVIHGDIMESPFTVSADVLWVYGILPCIPDQAEFLRRIVTLRRDDDAVALLYAYDKGSLRECIVETARAGRVYDTFAAFEADSLLFSPQARLRARDDLTAPHVNWSSQDDLEQLANSVGLHAIKTMTDFPRWQLPPEPSLEFRPQHLVCSFRPQPSRLSPEPPRQEAFDVALMTALGRAFVRHATPEQRRTFPIGLCNTHFVHGRSLQDQLVQDYLFLAYALVVAGIEPDLDGDAADIWQATLQASSGHLPRIEPALVERSAIARHVGAHSVRF